MKESPTKELTFKTPHRRDASVTLDRGEVERMVEKHLESEYGLRRDGARRTFDFAFDVRERPGAGPELVGLTIKIGEDFTQPIGAPATTRKKER